MIETIEEKQIIPVKTFQYKSVLFSLYVDKDWEIDRKYFWTYCGDLVIQKFNEYGQQGWEVFNWSIDDITFYDSEDIKKWSQCQGHNKPYNHFKVRVILKKETIELKELKNEDKRK